MGGAEKNIFLAPPRAIIPDARTLGTFEDAVYLNDLTKIGDCEQSTLCTLKLCSRLLLVSEFLYVKGRVGSSRSRK